MNLELLASFGDHVSLTQFKADDTISVLAFSQNGQFLASGDQAGRVVIFQLQPPRNANGKTVVSFVNQVHAHKNQFDYFRSELAEPKINSLSWVKSNSLNPLLLTCNSHEAKLWRMNQAAKPTWGPLDTTLSADQFTLPSPRQIEIKYTTEHVKTFTDIHTEYLIDVQTLSDQKSFVMVDVGCVKLWDMERSVESVSLFRVPQQNVELTASAVTPTLPSAILIADDAGFAKIIDMRQQAEDPSPSLTFNIKQHTNPKRSVSGCEYVGSVAFSNDGINIVTRTFGEAQVWDVRNPSAPAAQCDVQWFPGQMEWLANDEYTKDIFRTCFTPSGKVVTGNYSADFISWDWKTNEINRHKAVSARTPRTPQDPGRDFSKRVTVCEAHPRHEIVAVVSTAALYLFNAKNE
ncbi:hypothetical protein TVAG_481490 [Trichomonas vaginalis G3]|uniref:Serine/threonine-protein phosphatase 2A 55 kDa regulatory subunit B n=1 Tax=Trichomonas vaginalis (strain ATCC PRA-98 / G3) TaxID=412133 RepID=A2GJ64_TRIV3|nr:peptidyl-serine dephosphorylation [Trichomonas vaginalis G3]EAX82803.1 hypothetical protein TVAG_481490 [Trichomonas vaginalis G3]KAI5545185.1 peptidyl-serine dephosphorylation [Trichomonas vaginalis G3]|eukprot:XP_001295733.1 hypothetical protein [Trichomonas vaginalis G3]